MPIARTFANQGSVVTVLSFVSQFEVTEGLVVVSLLLLFVVIAKSCRFGLLFDSSIVSSHLKPRLSYLFAVLAVAGALSFTLLVLCNMKQLCNILDINGWNVVQYPLNLLGFLGGSALGQNGRVGYGVLTFLVWGLTIIALSFAIGFVKAVKLFAVPSILFLTIVVLLFDPREMDSQAVNLLSGFTFNGISLLSNWFLLTVSLFLIIFEFVYESAQVRSKKKSTV